MPGKRRTLTFCLLAGAGIALIGCVTEDAISAEPVRSTTPPATASGISARNSVQQVEYATLSGGRTFIRLRFRHELKEKPTIVVGYHPVAYLLLDFLDMVNDSGAEVVEVGQRELRSLQLVGGGNRLRLVIRLGRPAPHEIEINGNELLVRLLRPVAAG